MTDHFLVSWTALKDGRYWTLLTSAFSHYLLLHLFINMYVFMGFGTAVEMALGTWPFVKFYLVAGVLSSLCHVLLSTFFLGQPDMGALGASGAVSGVIVVFSLLFPQEKVFLFGLIPMPAIWGALLAVGLDLWGLIAQKTAYSLPIGFGAHLGGALTGLLYYLLFLRR